ncbi:MAG TPA: hypothetical protein ENK73_00340 [Thiomicrospira sp.]|jgi:hypothetical protein|nr:hypothetical protein [Thiomicrospira sp.]
MIKPREKNAKVLYLPSTPLNLLVSVAHALAHAPFQSSQLVLIDQKNIQDNIYFNVLHEWKNSPFKKVLITSGSANGYQKIAERKANFKTLEGFVRDFPASAIAVGSDRRVEFQYLMHLRTLNSKNVEGWYLDDGLYSYAGRPSKWFKDWVNSALKKLSYGFWWQEPKTVGTSDWIKQAWLFSPERAVALIQNKPCHRILTEWFLTPRISEFVNLVLMEFGVSSQAGSQLSFIDVFILIPHPNNILKMDGYLERLERFLEKASQLGKKVAVKYHPRSNSFDDFKLEKRYGVIILPNNLAFEFILPILDSNTIILGDVSTVLMTAKWLRPDITSLAVLNEEDIFARRFKEIIDTLGISIIPSFDAVFNLSK